MQDYYIFNTFYNEHKDLIHMPKTDILLGATSIICYKKLGYKVKLYCLDTDIPFLKKHHLYELYDLIDTHLFKNNYLLNQIDPHNFWSARKLVAINHEVLLGNKGIYSDTDVVMFQSFDLNCDLLTWCLEYDIKKEVYYSGTNFSQPMNYHMPEYILNCDTAYNCGILGFKNKELYQIYFQEYLHFVMNNPCLLSNNAYACNAEQRILKGIADHLSGKVQCITTDESCGFSQKGNHYFFARGWGRAIKNTPYNDDQIYYLSILNHFIVGALNQLKDYSDVYNYYSNFSDFQSFLTYYA